MARVLLFAAAAAVAVVAARVGNAVVDHIADHLRLKAEMNKILSRPLVTTKALQQQWVAGLKADPVTHAGAFGLASAIETFGDPSTWEPYHCGNQERHNAHGTCGGMYSASNPRTWEHNNG